MQARIREDGRTRTRTFHCKVIVEHDKKPSTPGSGDGPDGGGGTEPGPPPPTPVPPPTPEPTSTLIPFQKLPCVVGVQAMTTFTAIAFIPAGATNITAQVLAAGSDQPLQRPVCPGMTEIPDDLQVLAPGMPSPTGTLPPAGEKAVVLMIAAQGTATGPSQFFDVKFSWTNA